MASDLASDILKVMQEYTYDVEKGIEKEVDNTSKEMVKELKVTSPKGTGGYGKGWSHKKDVKKKNSYGRVVYNKTDYQLTHLLEKGHMNRDGTSRTNPIPHIEPAEDRHSDELVGNIVRIIGGLS